MQTEPNSQPEAAPSATTHFTTTWGGLAIVVAGLLPLVVTLGSLDGGTFPMFWTGPLDLLSSLVLAIGLIILAFGLRGEGDIVGGSRWGQSALLVLGLAPVALDLFLRFSSSAPVDLADLLFDVVIFFNVLTAVSAVLAVAVIARVRLIPRYLRWGAAVVVGWGIVRACLDYFPFGLFPPGFARTYEALAPVILGVWTGAAIIQFLLMIALGIGLALYGNAGTLRRWRDTVDRNW